MGKIYFGTLNPGKLANLRAALQPAGYEVIGVQEIGLPLPEVAEEGSTAAENALSKAKAYARAIDKPVVALDSALYFDGLAVNKQPGVHVRRIPGHQGRPTDKAVSDYYRQLITEHGGHLTGYWEYALALAQPDGTAHVRLARTEPRFFRLPGSPVRVTGQPLESFQFYPPARKYLADMTAEEKGVLWQEAGEIVSRLLLDLEGESHSSQPAEK